MPPAGANAGRGIAHAPNVVPTPEPGRLYAADYKNNAVAIFETGTSAYPTGLVRRGTISRGVSQPIALAADAGGDLFVGNAGDNTVTEYAPGKSSPAVTIHQVFHPQGLAVDAKGNLWVSQLPSSTALFAVVDEYAYSSSTKSFAAQPVKTIVGTGAASLVFPHGLAFDGAGNLFIADPGDPGVILKLAPGSNQPTVLHLPPLNVASPGMPEMQTPYDVRAAGSGRSETLYVSDFASGSAIAWTLGSSSTTWQNHGSAWTTATYLAIDGGGSVYASALQEYSAAAVWLVDPTGAEVGSDASLGTAEGLAFTTLSTPAIPTRKKASR